MPEIIVNMGNNDYVFTNSIVDPLSKSNIEAYVVKDTMPIIINFASYKINNKSGRLQSYYYREYNDKTIKIRCLDTIYNSGSEIMIVPQNVSNVLRVKNKLKDCLFVLSINYEINDNDENITKNKNFYFKILPEKEFEMFKQIELENNIKKDEDNIIRPKKIED